MLDDFFVRALLAGIGAFASATQDIAINATAGHLYMTGFENKNTTCNPVQVAYLRAVQYDGTEIWRLLFRNGSSQLPVIVSLTYGGFPLRNPQHVTLVLTIQAAPRHHALAGSTSAVQGATTAGSTIGQGATGGEFVCLRSRGGSHTPAEATDT